MSRPKALRIAAERHPAWVGSVLLARIDPEASRSRLAGDLLHVCNDYPDNHRALCGAVVSRIVEPWSGLSYNVCADCARLRAGGAP